MKLIIAKDKSKIILKESTHEEYHQLKLHLTKKVDNYFFKQRHKMGLWDGSIDHFHNGIIRYGLWKEVFRCCKEHGYRFDVDKNDFPFDLKISKEDIDTFCDEYYGDYRVGKSLQNPEGVFIPYDHQKNAIVNMLKYKFGIIEVATAGGKSLIFGTMLFYILRNIKPSAKTLLIVPRMSLVTQFYDDIIDYQMGYNKEQKNPVPIEIEEVFSDRPRKPRDGVNPNLYIGTYQSLINYPDEFFHQFDVVVTDECLHPNTLISMADGSKKKISDVIIGDEVWTYNTHEKKKEVKEVDYVYENLSQHNELYEIELENGEIINITGNHKVYLSTNEWKRVDELSEDDDILNF